MQAPEVIKIAKNNNNLTSDKALANIIGVSDVSVMRWRLGTSIPTSNHAFQLAVLAEIDPDIFVAEMLAESAENPSLRKLFLRFKRSIVAALPFLLTLPQIVGEYVVYYVKL